ncbi:uncharacterized protein [Lolium perenne]|uniref:uncharacterized protein n=1 Tax=Lolium perenne TaxID=4522 RepID=UPI003A9A078C
MEIEGGQGWEGQKRRKNQVPSPTSPSVARGYTIVEEDDVALARSRPPMPSGSADELQEDLENHTVSKEDEEFRRCLAVLSTRRRPGTLVGRRLDNERQRLVYERLVLYRIRASKHAAKPTAAPPVSAARRRFRHPSLSLAPLSPRPATAPPRLSPRCRRCIAANAGGSRAAASGTARRQPQRPALPYRPTPAPLSPGGGRYRPRCRPRWHQPYNDPLCYHGQVDTCDWYFDRDYAVHSYLTDYQRLVLANGDDGMMFLEWEKYRSWFTSYEIDTEYIKYFEEISTKIKWIKEYMECERESHEWMDMEARGFQQAVKIAVDFPCISFDLAFTAYTDHLWSVRFDYVYCEDIDHLLFEIWNRVTAQKITFRDALRKVNQENLSPPHKGRMQFALDNCIYSNLQFSFDICVEGIPDDAPEDEARRLIAWAVWNKLPKRKTWNQYLMRKIQVAKHIGLDLQASSLRF